MQEKIRKSIITSAILGFFIPTASLLYVHKEGLAITSMALLLGSTLLLVYTPIAYFSTLLWIALSVQMLVWSSSFFLGIWYAYQGVSIEKILKEQGLWLTTYILLFLLIVIQFSSLPVSLFMAHDVHLSFKQNDVVIVQKNPSIKYLRALDYVVFLDNKYESAIGQLVALPGDVLEYDSNGSMLCNDEPCDFSLNLPAQPWIIPNDIMLIRSETYNLNDNDNRDMPRENGEYTNRDAFPIMILPMQRIKGRALFTLFSTDISNIGEKLSGDVIY